MKKTIGFCILSLIIGIIPTFFITKLYFKKDPLVITNTKIDTFYVTVEKIKTKIDTVERIKENTKYIYEKKALDIWNLSADDDWKYFINYLRTEFPSDSDTIKTNEYNFQ